MSSLTSSAPADLPTDFQIRRTLNLPLFVVTVVTIASLVPAGMFWHARMMQRISKSMLVRADALEAKSELRDAAEYLSRYLKVHPGDVDARVRLALTFEKSASTSRHQVIAIDLLYRAVGVAPQRTDVRSRLAWSLLDTGQIDSARQQAEELLELDPENTDGTTVRALAIYSQARNGREPEEEALRATQTALARTPEDVTLARTLAEIYRNMLKSPSVEERAALADQAMDQAVSRNDDARAYLERFRYRRAFQLPGIEDDLRAALERNPQNGTVLQTAAEFHARRSELAEAIKFYNQYLEFGRPVATVYVGLGQCYAGVGELDKASDTLSAGLKLFPNDSSAMLSLAEVLMRLDRLSEVEGWLEQLDAKVGSVTEGQTTSDIAPIRPAVQVLRAEWLAAHQRFQEAIRSASRVTVAGPQGSSTAGVLRRAYLVLGTCYDAMLAWDRAATAYEEAASILNDAPTRLAAANSWMLARRLDAAVEQCKQAIAIDRSLGKAWLLLCHLELQNQQRLTSSERNWEPLQNLLVELHSAMPDVWQAHVLRARYSLARYGKLSEPIYEGMRAAEIACSEESDLWRQFALLYEQGGRRDDADRSAAKFREVAGDGARAALLQTDLFESRGEVVAARKVLGPAIRQCTDGWRAALVSRIAEIEARAGAPKVAIRYLTSLHEQSPRDLRTIQRLSELCLEIDDLDAAMQWTQRLKEVEGSEGCFWRAAEARTLAAQAADSQDGNYRRAAELLAEIDGRRPFWAGTEALRGVLADVANDPRTATRAYAAAVELGADDTRIHRRLVELYFAQNQLEKAKQSLKHLSATQRNSSDLLAMAISIAMREGDTQRAIELAESVTKQDQESPAASIRLAQVLEAAGRSAEATEELERTVNRFGDRADSWHALLGAYIRANQMDVAENLLGRIRQAPLPERDRALLLARGSDAIGRITETREYFEQALQLDPEDRDVVVEFINFLIRVSPEEAEQRLRAELANGFDDNPMRNALARLLAAQGKRSEALQIVDALTEDSASEADLRLKATLLAAEGTPETTAQARQLLERVISDSRQVLPRDHYELAKLYEAEGKDQLARAQFQRLFGGATVPAVYLASYIEFLLKRTEYQEASRHLASLEAQSGKSWPVVSLRARLAYAKGEQAQEIATIESYASENIARAVGPQKSKLIIAIAQIYDAIELDSFTERWLRELETHDPANYEPLVRWLTYHDRPSEAVMLCIRKWQESADIEAARLLAGVASTGDLGSQLSKDVESTLSTALSRYEGDAELAYRVANYLLTRDRSDDAIKLFEQATELDPGHAMAWNNLAAVLAERPSEVGRALEYIDRAIELSPDTPLLLDTKATVLLELGQIPAATSLLEDIVAEYDVADPRIHFHLSVAYERSGARLKAQRALAKAMKLGLSDSYLSPQERTLFVRLAEEGTE